MSLSGPQQAPNDRSLDASGSKPHLFNEMQGLMNQLLSAQAGCERLEQHVNQPNQGYGSNLDDMPMIQVDPRQQAVANSAMRRNGSSFLDIDQHAF